jgi:hypothetical protein
VNRETDNSDQEIATSQDTALSDRTVGFCRPPEATRFKKGVSGNPKGRPKGSLNVTSAFQRVLREKVVINEHGKRKNVTKLEAALKQLVNKAASGDLRAISQLRELAAEAEEKQKTVGNEQSTALPELDQEVMRGILERFELHTDESSSPYKATAEEDAK